MLSKVCNATHREQQNVITAKAACATRLDGSLQPSEVVVPWDSIEQP
jgi:hypothetical protein